MIPTFFNPDFLGRRDLMLRFSWSRCRNWSRGTSANFSSTLKSSHLANMTNLKIFHLKAIHWKCEATFHPLTSHNPIIMNHDHDQDVFAKEVLAGTCPQSVRMESDHDQCILAKSSPKRYLYPQSTIQSDWCLHSRQCCSLCLTFKADEVSGEKEEVE